MPSLDESLITAWTQNSTTWILMMIIGYTLIETAQIRKKNRKHVITKNLMVILVSLFTFFIIGYAFAFGGSSGGVIGAKYEYVGVYSDNALYHERQFPFYFATSVIVGLIATGSMAERTRLEPLLVFIVFQNIILYPPILAWAWNLQGGFLKDLDFMDRGGTAVIFHTAAVAGIIGAIVVGPRYGRYMPKNEEQKIFAVQASQAKGNDLMMMYQYRSEKDISSVTAKVNNVNKSRNLAGLLEDAAQGNVSLDDHFLRKLRKLIKKATVAAGEDNDFYRIDNQMMVLGTFITILGWSMLNACGSGSHNINTVTGRFGAETAFLNTLLAGSFSAFWSILLKRYIVRGGDHMKTQRYDVRSLCNGYLTGIAAVSAGCATMKPWGALVTGSIAGWLYMTLCLIARKSKFDDPMENFQIYTSAGFWGMIASAFFIPNKGVLWGGKESGSFIGIQFLSLVIITAWAILISWIYFFIMKRCKVLRLKKEEEVVGMDMLAYAKNKGLDIQQLLEAVSKMYPVSKRKGC